MDPADSPVDSALRAFEAAEANLSKLERLSEEMRQLVPADVAFGANPDYEERCRYYQDVLAELPAIDGWKPQAVPHDLDDIAQWRLDAREVDEVSAIVAAENEIDAPARELADYRHRFNKKRRHLIRNAVAGVLRRAQVLLDDLSQAHGAAPTDVGAKLDQAGLDGLRQCVQEIDRLLGSSLARPDRWTDLRRHLHFGQVGDLLDILRLDWPSVRAGLTAGLYDKNEPLPVGVNDLGTLAAEQPVGPIATRLRWETLSDEEFERVLFALIGSASGYENVQWLTRTNAPDRGRDISAVRVTKDQLSGVIRSRVIIQCKHWLDRSVGVPEVATLKEQMRLHDPRVDVLVIATSGRFSGDGVSAIERHNNEDRALKIEMWPESHLERVLAERPALIAEFHLR